MANLKTAWLNLQDGLGNRFAWSHVKSIYYNWATKVLLKTKLDNMDALIDAKIAKAMMTSQNVNDTNKVPTASLTYAMQQTVDQLGTGKIATSKIVNNFLSTDVTAVAAAPTVKNLDERVTQLNGELKIYTFEPKIFSSVPDIDDFYNNYSNAIPNHTWYRFATNHIIMHPELGGGVFYVEGFKTGSAYEYQAVRTYGTNGYNEYGRSKYDGLWQAWTMQ